MKMILFSSRRLEEKLAEGAVSEWDKVKYLLFPLIASAMLGGPIFMIRPHYGLKAPAFAALGNLIGGLLSAGVTYWGIRRAFRTNLAIDGERFVERYTVLSFPILFKMAVGFIPGLVVLAMVLRLVDAIIPGVMHQYTLVFNALVPLVMLWFYELLNRSFERLHHMIRTRRK